MESMYAPDQEPMSPTAHELIIQILQKYTLFWHKKWSLDQVTILHITQQLSSHDTCKNMTWLDDQDHYAKNQHKKKFRMISIMSS